MKKHATGGETPIYSVSSLLVYDRCPWQYYQTFVRGIAPPITPGMRRGTSIHAAINRHLKGTLLEPELEPEVRALLETFKHSRFNQPPVATERPFVLPFDRGRARGRIDLILPSPEGGLEIVDFKSGGKPEEENLAQHLQLPLYALAASRRFQRPPDDLSYTYYFLRDGTEAHFEANEELFDAVAIRVNRIMQGIQEQRFAPRPGCDCHACRSR